MLYHLTIQPVHQNINEKAYLLTDDVTGKPYLKDAILIKIKTYSNETHFVTNKGLWSVNTEKLIHKLSSQYKLQYLFNSNHAPFALITFKQQNSNNEVIVY